MLRFRDGDSNMKKRNKISMMKKTASLAISSFIMAALTLGVSSVTTITDASHRTENTIVERERAGKDTFYGINPLSDTLMHSDIKPIYPGIEPITVCIPSVRINLPVREEVGRLALEVYAYSINTGKYRYLVNDCYDFLTKIAWAAKYGVSVDKVRESGWNGWRNIYELGWDKRIKFNIRNLSNIKTGDFIYVDHSPISFNHTHWGILVKIKDKPYVIHKTNSTASLNSLKWFIRNCKCDRHVKIFRNDDVLERQAVLTIPSSDVLVGRYEYKNSYK
ncbi:hypothetical protein J7J26_00290 [Candidatus Micrarchaeota archaeon]|nr:hypothetical protein [Candidatus Micrarchaeota archaeon]